MKNLVFFLGGADAEMKEIEKALADAGAETINKNLGWGAHASAYAEEIAAAAADGKKVVLVELGNSLVAKTEWALAKEPVALPDSAVLIDHHGDRSGEPASIIQVLTLLGLEPTRRDLLIAANDNAFFAGMLAMGATMDEAMEIRRYDWECQGITSEQIAQSQTAVGAVEELKNNLFVVRLPHSRTAPTFDFLAAKYGLEFNNFLALSFEGEQLKEVNMSADGGLCKAFKEFAETYEGGSAWGGNENFGIRGSRFSAFAGASGKKMTAYEVVEFCQKYFAK